MNIVSVYKDIKEKILDLLGLNEEETGYLINFLQTQQEEINRQERKNNWHQNLERNVSNGCKDSDGLYTASCN